MAHTLTLSASHRHRRLAPDHFSEADVPRASIREQVLKRDNYTCQFCSLRFMRHMEASNLNGDHDDNRLDNLATICPLCHQVEHLFQAGYTDGGVLIHFPNTSQCDVNYVALMAWFVIDNTSTPPDWFVENDPQPQGDNATADDLHAWTLRLTSEELLRTMDMTKSKWTNLLNPIVAEPLTLADILASIEIEHPEVYRTRAERLAGLRLLPDRGRFEKQIADWWPELLRTRPLNKWDGAMKRYLSNSGLTFDDMFTRVKDIMDAPRVLTTPKPADENPTPTPDSQTLKSTVSSRYNEI